jgi:hypothetical protein
MRNIIKIPTLICIVMALNMVNLQYPSGHDLSGNRVLAGETNLSEYAWGKRSQLGYKPVPDVPQYRKLTTRQDGDSYHDNFLYKNWCEETFDNGKYIYAAYKNIAFNIKYKREAKKTDFWQTPIETDRLKKGDCEDAVFLLFSQLPSNQENAEIVWGWVIDKQTKAAKPHVWYQLVDKKGQKYIVEGFSKDWNGIIPMEIAKEHESRKPIFSIPHAKVIELTSLLLEASDRQVYEPLMNLLRPANFSNIDFDNQNHLLKTRTRPHHLNYEFIGYPVNTQDRSRNSASHRMHPKMRKEIFNIFKKLRKMFSRYEEQQVEFYTYMQISNRIDLRQIRMDNNLRQ